MAITDFPIQTVLATASNVANVPAAPITATNVQAAIDQLAGSAALFNVKNYGAVGNGSMDDSTSIHAAVNAAYAARGSLYIPAGAYRIVSNGVLTPDYSTNLDGIRMHGDGAKVSLLLLDTSGAGSDVYFYDNVATPRTLGNYYCDLGFLGMSTPYTGYASIPARSNGFREWSTTASGAHEQNFHFSRCEFAYLNNVFVTLPDPGGNTASENNWSQCEFFFIKNSILSINNVQSFNHEFHACNFSNLFGGAFAVNVGGGAIKMYGGSVILSSDRGTDSYFIGFGTAGAGQGGDPFTFNGIRFEFRGNTTKLAGMGPTCQADINFNDCLFEDQGSIVKNDFVAIGSHTHLAFNKCVFFELGGGAMLFDAYDGNTYNQGGSIVFEACALPTDWSDRCAVTNYNSISARNCYGTNVGAQTSGMHWAHDFDVRKDENVPGLYTGWTATAADPGAPTNNMLRLKAASLLCNFEQWPGDTNELQLRLPRNAIIKNIHLRKPPGGADATVCTQNVSRNNKSGTTHLTSDAQAMSAAQTGDKLNYFYNVGTTDNERNLRLYTNVPTTGPYSGGFCIVEYY